MRRKEIKMQYILTEDEYKALIPISRMEMLIKDIELLNDKVMELTEHPCGSDSDYRSINFYCDDCPIGKFGTGTCTKRQQYSK